MGSFPPSFKPSFPALTEAFLFISHGFSSSWSPSNTIHFLLLSPSFIPDSAWWWCTACPSRIHSYGRGFRSTFPGWCGWTDRIVWGCSSRRCCPPAQSTGRRRTPRSSGFGRIRCRLRGGGKWEGWYQTENTKGHFLHIMRLHIKQLVSLTLTVLLSGTNSSSFWQESFNAKTTTSAVSTELAWRMLAYDSTSSTLACCILFFLNARPS